MGKKLIEHLEPQKLSNQSSRLWTVTKVYSKNSSNCSCANTATVPDIILVSEVKFGKLCTSKGLQVYVIKWKNLQDLLSDWESAEIVAAVRSESNEGPVKQIVLSEKYFDFSDIFDKAKADKLPKHLHYDLTIELINDKQPLFGPIYNLFKTELEVIHEYMNEILAKKFIQPSKSPSKALVLFLPKKIVVCAYV